MKKNSDKTKVIKNTDHGTGTQKPKPKKDGGETRTKAVKAQQKSIEPVDKPQGENQGKFVHENHLDSGINESLRVEQLSIVGYVNPIDDPTYSAYVSPQVKTMLGYSAEEWLANPRLWSEILHPLDREHVLTELEHLKITGGELDIEYRVTALGGNVVWVHDHLVLVRDVEGHPQFWQGMMIDVTQRKQAEKSLVENEERYRSIAEDMPVLISRFKHDGTLTYVNRFYCEYYKTSAEELLGKNLFEMVPKNEQEFVRRKYLSLSIDQPYISYEFQAFDANQVERWQRWTDRALFDQNGEIIEFQSIGEDITDRKQAEQLLIESEARFRSLIANAGDMITVINQEGNITYISPSFERALGYVPQDMLGENFMKWIHPDNLAEVKASLESRSKTPGTAPQSIKVRGKHKNGSWRYLDALGTNLLDDPSIKGIVLNIRDVTEHEKVEQFAQSTIDALSAHICVLDNSGRILSVNRAWREFADANPPAPENYTIGMNYLKVTEKAARSKAEGAEQFASKLSEVLTGECDTFTMEYPCHSPKEKRWFICRVTKFEDGGSSRIVIAHENITTQKIFEQTLKESEERFQLLFTHSPDAILLIDPFSTPEPWAILDCNEAAGRINGYRREELIGKSVEILNTPNNNAAEDHAKYLEQLRNAGALKYETEHRHRDGHIFPVEVSTSFVTLAGRELILGIDRDITERKRTEEVLKESETRFLSAFENASIGMALVSTDGRMYQTNQALCDFLGYTEDELVKITFQEITHPDDLSLDLQNLQQLMDGSVETYQMDKRYRHKLGHFVWGSLNVSMVKNDKGVPLYFVSQIKDITERIRTDAEINRQLSELETLYESGLAINSLYTPKEIAQKVIEILERRMAWHHIAIRQHDAGANTVELLAFHSSTLTAQQNEETIKRINQIIYKPGDGLSGWVTMSGTSIRVPQVKKDKRYKEVYPEIQSGLYAPLKIGEKVIGSISVESEEENGFTEHDERLLVTLAAQAAVSIENATLYLRAQTEISERKLAEDTLQKQTEELVLLNSELEHRVAERTAEIELVRQRLELATKAAGLGIWEWNINSGSMIWNNQMHIIFELSPGAFDNTMNGFINYIHLDDLQSFTDLMHEIVSGKNYFELSYRIIRPDGSIRFVHSHGLGLLDQDGRIERMIGTADDVTQQRQSEQALLENEAYSRLLFDASPDPISVSEADGIMVDVNRIFEIQHRVKREDVRGKHISELNIYPAEEIQKATEYVNEILQGKKLSPVELDYYASDHGLHTLEMRSYPIEVYGRSLILSTSRDITEQKMTADILRRANNEMERALRIKDEFLASMSHELRTPLNAILGISESLEEQIIGPLNDKQVKYLHTVSESGHHLLELINDILDLSKIEAGHIELNMAQIPTDHLVQSSLRIIKEMAQKRDLRLNVDVDPNVKIIKGDERRLKQVLVNLLSNAVKFTKQGGEIGLELKGNPQDAEVTITIWDSGIGIKEKDISRLFKPFVQLDSSLSREYAGTGLGLALVAQMIRLHGGSVQLTSEVGKGSRFTVTIPWEPDNQTISVVSDSPTETHTLPPLGTKRAGKVMVFEDTESISQLLNDYIIYLGYKPVIARNGLEGLIIARHEKPDIIFMDVMMPGMDGLEATKQIRADEKLKDIPIIALTALAMPGDREACIAAGMNDYLSKPIRMNEIYEMIAKHLINK